MENDFSKMVINIIERMSLKDKMFLKFIIEKPNSTIEELSALSKTHRTTAAKHLNFLYKACIINKEQLSEEKNKIIYKPNAFGKSILNKITGGMK